MTLVMNGVRVLEVAQYVFVPSAGTILAEWGAEVIKVEHPVRGDAQRGLSRLGGLAIDPNRNPVLEHANRGKRSIGIDISQPDGLALVLELAKDCDIFTTNYLPAIRAKLGIDVADLRAVNPKIIYARGSALGDKGPERDIGGFDVNVFWSRSGIAYSQTPEDMDIPLMQGIGGFGDSTAGMALAGGIAAALFHRAQTGEATEVDVSLLSTAWWSAGIGVNTASLSGIVKRCPSPRIGSAPGAPLLGNFFTEDKRVINLFTMQPGPHFSSLCAHIDQADLVDDPRFADAKLLMENWEELSTILEAAFASRSFAFWKERLKTYSGQWAPLQTFVDLIEDEQAQANDMLMEINTNDSELPMRVVRAPVQFDGTGQPVKPAPQASEHTEIILLELGKSWEEIERLKQFDVIA